MAAIRWLRTGCVIGLVLVAGAALAERGGQLTDVRGEVQVRRSGELAFGQAATGQRVRVGDHIQTGARSSATLILDDETLIHLGERTGFEIEALPAPGDGDAAGVRVRQHRGRMRTVVPGAGPRTGDYQVRLPHAVVRAIRTDFETREDPLPEGARWRVCLEHGRIEVSNDHGRIEPAADECVHVTADAAPGGRFPNPEPPFEPRAEAQTAGGGETPPSIDEIDVAAPPGTAEDVGEDMVSPPAASDYRVRTVPPEDSDDELEADATRGHDLEMEVLPEPDPEPDPDPQTRGPW
ncbi:MAG: FecR domain-containing protein [Myxococcales bacterium]|nr:FecR domain-containing protein [Myxococcales bacterium]